ncbi:hypothetical protein MPNT_30151 [Candidatus Methylacidithermus pantelleriae]|uniref:Uncharacterized protein n=1 Tax=Candidatus Methylacidithermus pantelleriae TaxID=2744239 RepID=A0A8J2FWI9_9BACT|nr:hypothetical protein MPNT_30151 [Candidatus Methylacidithermus pantelleriae]
MIIVNGFQWAKIKLAYVDRLFWISSPALFAPKLYETLLCLHGPIPRHSLGSRYAPVSCGGVSGYRVNATGAAATPGRNTSSSIAQNRANSMSVRKSDLSGKKRATFTLLGQEGTAVVLFQKIEQPGRFGVEPQFATLLKEELLLLGALSIPELFHPPTPLLHFLRCSRDPVGFYPMKDGFVRFRSGDGFSKGFWIQSFELEKLLI